MTARALPTHRKCILVATETSGVDLDAFSLLHAQSLIAIEGERNTRERERNDDIGGALLQQILDGTAGRDNAQPRLEQAGMADMEWIVISFAAAHLQAARIVLADSAIATLSCVVGEKGYVVISAARREGAYPCSRRTYPTSGPPVALL